MEKARLLAPTGWVSLRERTHNIPSPLSSGSVDVTGKFSARFPTVFPQAKQMGKLTRIPGRQEF